MHALGETMYQQMLDSCNGYNLQRAARRASKFYDLHLALTSISADQFYLLLIICTQGANACVADIARQLGVDRSTCSRQLRTLKSKGLIELIPPLPDKRLKSYTVTEDGRKMLAVAVPLWTYAQTIFIRKITKKSHEDLLELLKKCLDVKFLKF